MFFTICFLSCFIVKLSCNIRNTSEEIKITSENSSTINVHENKLTKMNNNCILIVNGKELTNVVFNGDSFELPILLISQELGAEIKWEGSKRVIIYNYGKSVVLDALEVDFGLAVPPGSIGAIRRLEDNEIIIDDISARGIIKNLLNAEISYDVARGQFCVFR